MQTPLNLTSVKNEIMMRTAYNKKKMLLLLTPWKSMLNIFQNPICLQKILSHPSVWNSHYIYSHSEYANNVWLKTGQSHLSVHSHLYFLTTSCTHSKLNLHNMTIVHYFKPYLFLFMDFFGTNFIFYLWMWFDNVCFFQQISPVESKTEKKREKKAATIYLNT